MSASLADVKAGLEHRSQVKGRLFPIQVNENLLLLDDTYNANVLFFYKRRLYFKRLRCFPYSTLGAI